MPGDPRRSCETACGTCGKAATPATERAKNRNFLKKIRNFLKYASAKIRAWSQTVTNRCCMDIQFPEFEIFAPKVEAAWSALQQRYANRLTEAELDYLFACLVLGLTSPAYGEGKPSLHFDVCRALVAMKLPPDRADAALHSVPAPTEPWVESLREQLESQSARMGQTLLDMRNFNDDAAADAVSGAPSRPVNSEDKAA